MTAVEWLEIHWAKHYDFDDLDLYLIGRAKEMEKEQHQETWETAHQAGRFEGYYNETFKSE